MSHGRERGRIVDRTREDAAMSIVTTEISMSLDGFVAGPEPSATDPLGVGGMDLHEWAFRLAAWREAHGLEGGEVDVDSELVERAGASRGAVVMGRRMFSGGAGPWEDDPNAGGWWGEEPPFHCPVFVVTHHERAPLELRGTTFEFVTAGVGKAVEGARLAAAGKDVLVAGGGAVVQQSLRAGLVDELLIHVVPLFLGGGTRLFEAVPARRLEVAEVVAAPRATHIRYRVAR
jgi:dihydrofolate reductase